MVITGLAAAWSFLVVFCIVETKIAEPMFRMGLFKIRAFAAGNAASLMSSMARGGLQFMLVIWLAGIWLPLHGYDYTVTPLWAGIYMLPLTGRLPHRGTDLGLPVGSVRLAPVRDRRACWWPPAASPGCCCCPSTSRTRSSPRSSSATGSAPGLFASPNTSSIMSSVPAEHRGAASGMRSVFMNSGMSLSIGFFFSLMIAGLATTLPRTLSAGLRAQGVPAAVAAHIASLPPVSTLFSALLGYNPVQEPAHAVGRAGQAAGLTTPRC